MGDEELLGREFAGYRLVRRLGSGSRSTVFLAACDDGTVALKIHLAGVSRESIGAEVAALDAVQSPHLVRLVDVVQDLVQDSGRPPSLAFERVRGGSLAARIVERETLEPGEVVTLVAPIARLVGELHAAGVAHGGLGLRSIHLGDRGEPILLGFGRAILFARDLPLAALDREPGALTDRKSLAALTTRLLDRIRAASTDPSIESLRSWVEHRHAASEFSVELEQRLFDWADAEPVRFAAATNAPNAVSRVPARAIPAAGGVGVSAFRDEASLRRPAGEPMTAIDEAPGATGSGGALPAWLPVALVEDPMSFLRDRLLPAIRSIRRPFWIAAAACVAAFILALALIPSGNAVPATAHVTRPLPVVPTSTLSPLPADPAAALPLLLHTRERCFRELSLLCLDEVDEPASAALTTDSAAIQQVEDGGEEPAAADGAASAGSLVELLGDSALFTLVVPGAGASEAPARILIIKTLAGWRIRDVLSGKQATGSSPAPVG